MKNTEVVTCVILGGGGHAGMLIDSLRVGGYVAPCAILDSDESRWGTELLGVPITGNDRLLPEMVAQGTEYFMVGLGSTGDNRPRRRLFDLGLSHNLKPLTVVHPSAVCSRWATIGSGAQVLPLSIINAGTKIGANVIVNSGAIVEHDCLIEDHAHIATGAALAGGIRLGTGAHVGAGATVKQRLEVGEWAIIGAGAVVTKDVRAGAVVVGVPARELGKSVAGDHMNKGQND